MRVFGADHEQLGAVLFVQDTWILCSFFLHSLAVALQVTEQRLDEALLLAEPV